MPNRVAIIGGGYAGLAAGVCLAQRGIAVTLYEAATTLGGRARRISYQGETLDNGQHILLGAYIVLRELIELVAPGRDTFLRARLHLQVHNKLVIQSWPLPAPLNIALGFLAADGVAWRERIAALRFLARIKTTPARPQATVDQWLAENGQTGRLLPLFWQPLCTAALNTPPAAASAEVFRSTLLAAFAGHTRDSDLLFSRCDLSALFPEPAARYIAANGGEVRSASTVSAVTQTTQGFAIATRATRELYSHVICAIAPRQAQRLLEFADIAGFRRFAEQVSFEPIYTIYLKYAAPPRLDFPMVGLSGGLTQWVFDRAALGFSGAQIACVISASGPHQALSRAMILQQVSAELRGAFGWAEPLWSKLVIEKQATFAAVPGLPRPAQKTELAGLYLAGDYTAGPYPATLEAAVASGKRCAEHIAAELK